MKTRVDNPIHSASYQSVPAKFRFLSVGEGPGCRSWREHFQFNAGLMGGFLTRKIAQTFLGSVLLAVMAAPGGATVAELQLLPADVLNTDNQFGAAVAISEDGNTVVVGAPKKEINGNLYAGAAYIFVRSGSNWIQQARLTGSGVQGFANEHFGFAVGISGDHVIVGTDASKAAYMFARNGTNWVSQTMRFEEVTVFTPSWRYGSAVAVSGDLAIVGDYQWGSENGAVLFFHRVGNEWLTSLDNVLFGTHSYEWYGYAVAANGARGIAGGPYESVGNSYPGAAWVYPAGARLSQDPSANSACFGNSVALSSEGTMAVVGAPFEDQNNVGGAVYVFSEPTLPAMWGQQARLTIAGGGYHDGFGYSCAAGAGKIVIGAPLQNGLRGAVYYFKGTGADWTQQEPIYASQSQESDRFGYSVAMAGGTVVIGAPGIDQPRGGKAFIYEIPTPLTYTLSLAMDSAQRRLRFPSVLGRHYRVERSTTLQPDSWSPVSDDLAGTGALLEVTDGTSTGTAGFYRLVVLP